ncbi:MAG: MucR family transcriptional regulator [Rickettsiales bacterium]|jgi:predicted transcriptional regulator|nr:MucR family transcriptional regulator [Rickettsiales bacterium]
MSENTKNLPEETLRAIISATAEIVGGYVENNKVGGNKIAPIIDEVYGALASAAAKTGSMSLEPAVAIADSVKPEYVVCLEDGKKLKMLKRYLKTKYDMSAADYREKWNLPPDYPMIAPNYAKKRSALAKKSGLGKK